MIEDRLRYKNPQAKPRQHSATPTAYINDINRGKEVREPKKQKVSVEVQTLHPGVGSSFKRSTGSTRNRK